MKNIPSEVHTVLETLTAAGEQAYLVGGCVRDLLRGGTPSDYDLTTSALPERVMALFGGHARPTGLPHGTVTVVSEGRPIEITTMRCDGAYHDNRHPESVRFTDRVEEDLARRDFTVNAMAMTGGGTVIDLYGGQGDLNARRLRCVGQAEARFTEDALRILRLLRFASVLGFATEDKTAAAAKEKCALLRNIAHERVYAELNKLLCGGEVTRVLLDFPEVLGTVLPEILPTVGFDQRNFHHCYDVWGHTAYAVGAVPPVRELRWTMLFHDLGKPRCFTLDERGVGHYYGHTAVSAEMAKDVMERLHFERSLRDAVLAQLACFDDVFPPERAAIHKEMAKRGRAVVGGLLYTKLADNAAKAPEGLERAQAPYLAAREIYDALCAEGACCTTGELAVSGGDMMALGFSGKAIGEVLQRLLEEAAAEKLPNEREKLLARAERLHRSGFGTLMTEQCKTGKNEDMIYERAALNATKGYLSAEGKHMAKEMQYQQLVADVRDAYLNRQGELKWCKDCREINLWTYWQGRGHLDAEVMLVGQDWGCPRDAGAETVMQAVQSMNNGQATNYMDGNDNPTDNNLAELFQSIGFDIRRDDTRLFFTNFVLGYRTKGTSGNFKASWAAADAPYFRRLAEIIRPRAILCLGKDTLSGVLRCFDCPLPKNKSYNQIIESDENPMTVQYADGTTAYVFALAHCGIMGTLNRNRGSGDKLSLNRQKEDWQKILPVLWREATLLRTYWEPSIRLLREIEASDEKKAWCADYSVYVSNKDKFGLEQRIDRFYHETYRSGLVVTNYRNIMEKLGLDEDKVCDADAAWVSALTLEGAAASLAYHFRWDHFCEGHLVSESIVKGCILRLMERLYTLLMATGTKNAL